jgi:hypothetical protein
VEILSLICIWFFNCSGMAYFFFDFGWYYRKFRRTCSSGLYSLTFMDDSKKFPLNNTSSFLVATNADKSNLCTRLLVTANIITLLSWLYPVSADIAAVCFLLFCSSLGGCESASTSDQLFSVFLMFSLFQGWVIRFLIVGQMLFWSDYRPGNLTKTFCS